MHPTALTLQLVAASVCGELPVTQATVDALQEKCVGAGALLTLYRQALQTWRDNILPADGSQESASQAELSRAGLDQLIAMTPEQALAALRSE